MKTLISPIVLSTLLTFSTAAFAEETTKAQANTDIIAEQLKKRDEAIARVIADQLDAFSKDDGERAFSHASPTIKNYFKNPGNFMVMVTKTYGMIYRPSSHELDEVRELAGKIYQPATFIDQDNRRFKAFYEMQLQEDNSWKINGVQLFKKKELAV